MNTEYECATAQADRFGTAEFRHLTTDHLSTVGESSLTDEGIDVEEADLERDEVPVPGSYVPFRNPNLLSMATSYAEAADCDAAVAVRCP